MSALTLKLLYLCVLVWSSMHQGNGIQNLRYPSRFSNNQLKFGKRQDFLAKSRLFMWKPALAPGKIYPNIKTPTIPVHFNSYGIPPPPPPPQMTPIHQGYMFALPTKVNYPSYQAIKEIDEKRKSGNLHHITIINAIMPKSYLPTIPTHSHPTTAFRNYRTNKLLYHQYFNNNFGHQKKENFNKINEQRIQYQQLQQQQQKPFQMAYHSTPLALKFSSPTMEYVNVNHYNNNHNENEINKPISLCGRKTKDDPNISSSGVSYYYCNNRITNYKNPTQQQQVVPVQPTTISNVTSTTSTTTTSTTAVPLITTTATKSSYFDFFPTEKPIFLPTPNDNLIEDSFTPITTISQTNSIIDSGTHNNLILQKQKHRPDNSVLFEDIKPQRQTLIRYEDIKRQRQYTTDAAVYDNKKLHSFFTIEDAVTRAPQMQVFNDPYQAYRHARRHHQNKHLRQTTINTTTKKPDTTTNKTKFKSFFNDLEDEDYTLPEAHQYDYSLFTSNPQKSAFQKIEFDKQPSRFSQNNQITEHMYSKSTNGNSFFDVDAPYMGKPKIKEHSFGLFRAISPTTYKTLDITTYKPYENLKDFFLTTHKIPTSSFHNSSPITFTTTTETVLRNLEAITEAENTTFNVLSNEVHTTASIPITTTTDRKYNRNILKSPINLRSPTTYKYPKLRRVHKTFTNLTSTTTTATPQTLKKIPKYQRQYKTKKLKQFKHLYTTTSTSTTTTAMPTTTETPAKITSVRLLPTTSTTEEDLITKKPVSFSRTLSTRATTKTNRLRQQSSTTSPSTTTAETILSNRKKKTKTRTVSTKASFEDKPSTTRQSTRRGSKRSNIVKSKKETTEPTRRKTENKNRRRINTFSTSTPATKSFISRTTSSTTSTTTTPLTPISTSLRTSATTTTTMKSIMRIANSKLRTKNHDHIKLLGKNLNEVNWKDDVRHVFDEKISLKPMISTTASIPPLPIEIYFKKSHNVNI